MRIPHPFRGESPVLGLALSGGAIRGAAHIGVLQVLESAGIVPEIITGTSAGAIVGGTYAAGHRVEAIREVFREVRWPRLAHLSIREHLSLFSTAPFARLIESLVGGRKFEDLGVRFVAVACDILTGDRVVLDRGPVARAVTASSAVPGFFTPVVLGPRLLVDGGLVDNLPVQLARDMGATFVLAVDVLSRPDGRLRPANPLDMLTHAAAISSHSNHPDPKTVDCYVSPRVADLSLVSFRDVKTLEERGRAAMEKALPALRAGLGTT